MIRSRIKKFNEIVLIAYRDIQSGAGELLARFESARLHLVFRFYIVERRRGYDPRAAEHFLPPALRDFFAR